ncbi:MAG TPA: hypothetical protein VL403_06280 [Candidatus Kryptonia bacterium]|nr:hypothetical protein [Candidatus Kryptonia bacterium]
MSSITIGGVSYSKTQAIAILSTSTWGDVTYLLADELIAAKLNIANGASGSTIAATIMSADGWLIAHPLGSNLSDSARQQGLTLWGTLDDYNDGRLGPARCDSSD